MKALFILLGLLAILLVGYAVWRPVAGPAVAPLPPLAEQLPAAHRDFFTPAAQPPPEDPELADIPLDEEAIASLRGGRMFGDPRTPPIERSAPQERASAEELADPAKYAEFEGRQERKLKRAYVIEAEKYIAQLHADLARGRAGGIPPDEIAKVEKKVKGIEEMRAKLLREDPGLLDGADTATP